MNVAQLIVQLVKISCYLVLRPPSLLKEEGRIVPSSRRRTYHQQSDFSLTVGLFLPHYVTSEVMDKGQFDLTHCGIIIQRLNSISADTNR